MDKYSHEEEVDRQTAEGMLGCMGLFLLLLIAGLLSCWVIYRIQGCL